MSKDLFDLWDARKPKRPWRDDTWKSPWISTDLDLAFYRNGVWVVGGCIMLHEDGRDG